MCRDRPDGAAVGDSLVHHEVETVVAPVGLGSVEGTLAARCGEPPARGALPRLVVGAFLVEQHVDARIRRGLEGLGPTRGRSAAAARTFAPAVDQRSLVLRARGVEDRARQLEQLLRRRMRFGARPADDRLLRPVREEILELRPRLLGRDDDHLRRAHPPHPPVELHGDVLQVLGDELLDVPLEAGLRPAALVVTARHIVGAVDELVEPPRAETEQLTALAADERDDRALAAPDERDERGEMKLTADPHAVRHGLDQRARPPDVVHPCQEDGNTARSVALELVGEVVADSGEIVLEADPLIVRQPAVVRLRVALALGEQCVDPRGRVARCRSGLRVEVEVEADRATLLRAELRELAEPVPAHGLGHVQSFPIGAAILRVCLRSSTRSDTAAELVECLRNADVETLVDVRRYPASRRNPQFNQATLAATLADAGIGYVHAAELGGLRTDEPGQELFGCLGQFAGYAARMRTPAWHPAREEALPQPRPCLMCAETPWQRCHRRLIAEFLAARDYEVVHLIRPGGREHHDPHPTTETRDGMLYLCGEPVREVSGDPIR